MVTSDSDKDDVEDSDNGNNDSDIDNFNCFGYIFTLFVNSTVMIHQYRVQHSISSSSVESIHELSCYVTPGQVQDRLTTHRCLELCLNGL